MLSMAPMENQGSKSVLGKDMRTRPHAPEMSKHAVSGVLIQGQGRQWVPRFCRVGDSNHGGQSGESGGTITGHLQLPFLVQLFPKA